MPTEFTHDRRSTDKIILEQIKGINADNVSLNIRLDNLSKMVEINSKINERLLGDMHDIKLSLVLMSGKIESGLALHAQTLEFRTSEIETIRGWLVGLVAGLLATLGTLVGHLLLGKGR